MPGFGPGERAVNMIRIRWLFQPENRALLEVIVRQVAEVPQPSLSDRWAQANFEHVPELLRVVYPTPVPDSVVHEQQRTGRTDDVLLANDILVTGNGRLADNA